MSIGSQTEVITGLALRLSELSSKYAVEVADSILTGIDSVLSDVEMSSIEKIGVIKVIMFTVWSRLTTLTHGNPNITIEEMAQESKK